MKLLAASLLALGLPLGTAHAQSTLVRTGEHGDFTRIAVDLPRGADWSVDREAATVRLSAPGAAGYDLSQAFTRISRERVARIEAGGNGDLVVTLGCACDIDTFQNAAGSVVIDVSEADGAPAPAPERAALFPDNPLRLPEPPALLPGPLSRALDPAEASRQNTEILTAARKTMTEQLARGASQGLVDVPVRPGRAPETPPAPVAREEEAPLVPDLGDSPYPNMRVETQIDRDWPGAALPDEHDGCLPASKFDFAAWGDEADPFARLRGLMPELMSEVDRKSGETYADVARAYLFLTFGAEARAVLADSPSDTPDRQVLIEIARAMDAGLGSAAFASQIDCDSNAALLAFLAEDGPVMEDPRIAIRRFLDLPMPLRGYVGPHLAERFVDAGLDEEARTVRNDYSREPAVSSSEDAFVAAKIGEGEGNAASQAGLEAVVEERLPRAAEAMTFLISSMLERGEAVPVETTDQALALSFETADPARAELERATLRAIAARPAIPAAFAELDRLRRVSRGPFEEVERELFAQVLESEGDAEFLRLAVPLVERPIEDPEIRLGIARRLREQSLWKQAETVIDASRDIPTPPERILRAEIASDAGKADVARSYLAGLEGDEVEAVRSRLVAEEPAPQDETGSDDAPPALLPGPSPEVSRAMDLISGTADLRAELDQLLSE